MSTKSPKNNYGNRTAIIIVTIIAILIILAIILQSVYKPAASNFGTYSNIVTSTCLNNGGGCTVAGSATQTQICNPNPNTGWGCLTPSGAQSFKNLTSTISCTPTCYSALWENNANTPCEVYTDLAATTLAADQSCVNNNPANYSFTKTSRTCIPFDATGSNSCIELDGTVAPIGYTELTNISCNTIPPCYPGTWAPCTINAITSNCGGTPAQCGEVIPATTPPLCQQVINGVPTIVNSSMCNPNDEPAMCVVGCFNNPCTTWPPGYANISSLVAYYLEFNNTITNKYLEAAFSTTTVTLAHNPITTTNGSSVVKVTTAAAFPFMNGQFVTLSGLVGDINGLINGIPVIQLNTSGVISMITVNSFMFTAATTNATSAGTGGGNAGVATQNQLAAAQPDQVALLNNPVTTTLGSNILIITTAVPHGFLTNQPITLSGITGVGGNINGIPITEINTEHIIYDATTVTFAITVTDIATSNGTGGGNAGEATRPSQDVLNTLGDVNTTFAATNQADTIRFQLLPSQAHTTDGVLYLVAYLPYNGQMGLAYWSGTMIRITAFPTITLGQTLDSLNLGNAFFFSLTQPSQPYQLNNVAYPGPIVTPIVCGITPCIGVTTKTCPLYDPPSCL